jgi:hypothetical protein
MNRLYGMDSGGCCGEGCLRIWKRARIRQGCWGYGARLEVGEEKERKLGKKVYKFSQALK